LLQRDFAFVPHGCAFDELAASSAHRRTSSSRAFVWPAGQEVIWRIVHPRGSRLGLCQA
jgi:hypothetical protein